MHFLSFLILTTLEILPILPLVSASSTPSVLRSLDTAPVLHFTLSRRGGVFAGTEFFQDIVNLTYLAQELERTESRFNLTKRAVKGNRLVRKAKLDEPLHHDGGALMGKIADDGLWYAKVKIGEPPQEIEMDLNMLASDFHVLMTTSRKGSRYDDLFSQTGGNFSLIKVAEAAVLKTLELVKSIDRPYPSCTLPTDSFRLPTINTSIPLSFVYCRPPKFSLGTLEASGSSLGLAPSQHLSQTGSKPLLKQLLEKKVIERPIFSLMLINGQAGVLSVGGTGAGAVAMVEQQTKDELDRAGAVERGETLPNESVEDIAKRNEMYAKSISASQTDWENNWRWNKVQGAEGWWQILLQGVWVDGGKALQNQGAVIDINSPFILAPPFAAKAFYASISGSRPLPPPYSNFYSFPCLNPPILHFEFGGWNFPLMQGGRGAEGMGIPGGKFSLGRLKRGSGYCVGAVVETRMGVSDERDGVARGRKGTVAGNGMKDVWVIGEGFFRGVGAVFDFQDQKVGFRTY